MRRLQVFCWRSVGEETTDAEEEDGDKEFFDKGDRQAKLLFSEDGLVGL